MKKLLIAAALLISSSTSAGTITLPWYDSIEGWIEYEIPGGANIRNGPGGWASRELTANAGLAGDTIVERLRAEMGAEVLANATNKPRRS